MVQFYFLHVSVHISMGLFLGSLILFLFSLPFRCKVWLFIEVFLVLQVGLYCYEYYLRTALTMSHRFGVIVFLVLFVSRYPLISTCMSELEQLPGSLWVLNIMSFRKMSVQKMWDRVEDKTQFCEWEDINTCLGLETDVDRTSEKVHKVKGY